MAKVTGPLHSSEARGGVGPLQFNTWRGLHTVRTRSGPTITHSDAQVALRALAAAATSAWQSLTDAQRDRWRTYSDFHLDPDWTGQPKHLSGYNWFIRINVRLQLLDLPIRIDPPEDFPPLLTSIADIFYDPNPDFGIIVETNFIWTLNAQYFCEYYHFGPHSQGLNPTIKAAGRAFGCDHLDIPWFSKINDIGRHSFWVRRIDKFGVAGGWIKCMIDVPPP